MRIVEIFSQFFSVVRKDSHANLALSTASYFYHFCAIILTVVDHMHKTLEWHICLVWENSFCVETVTWLGEHEWALYWCIQCWVLSVQYFCGTLRPVASCTVTATNYCLVQSFIKHVQSEIMLEWCRQGKKCVATLLMLGNNIVWMKQLHSQTVSYLTCTMVTTYQSVIGDVPKQLSYPLSGTVLV